MIFTVFKQRETHINQIKNSVVSMKDTISEHNNFPDNKKYCTQECDQKMQLSVAEAVRGGGGGGGGGGGVLNDNLVSQQLYVKKEKGGDKVMSRFSLSYASEALDDSFMELSLRLVMATAKSQLSQHPFPKGSSVLLQAAQLMQTQECCQANSCLSILKR